MTDRVLAHQLVTATPEAKPARWALFVHGMLGTGSNWRSFAKRVVTQAPANAWGAVLVDLRLHGGSREGFAPPHTLEALAHDLIALESALPGPVRGVVGHSLGAKAALAYAGLRGAALERAVFVDGMPGARPDARGSEFTLRVLGLLASRNERTFAARDEFVRSLTGEGISHDMALWLAMNLRAAGPSRDDGVRLGLDLEGLGALLDDYFSRDLWPVLENAPLSVEWHAVIGGASSVFAPDERARIAEIADRSRGVLRVHTIAHAGHWVHVDAPGETEEVLREAFVTRAPA